ncbi:MAG: hypothetical protein WAK84_11390 [Candidatus Cybelea sp.]
MPVLLIHAVMADSVAIAQGVFEENCVERWVMLVKVLGTFNILSPMRTNDARDFVNKGSAWGGEGNTSSGRARVGVGKKSARMLP